MTIPEGTPQVLNTPPAPAPSPEPEPAKQGETVSVEEYKKVLEEKDRLFARAKRAEEALREPKGETPPVPPTPAKPPTDPSNPFELAKAVAALKDYDQAEIDFASTIAKAKNIQPADAVQSQEFKYWLKGKREEDLRNKQTPSPTNPASPTGLPERDKIGTMSTSEFQRLEKEHLEKRMKGGF